MQGRRAILRTPPGGGDLPMIDLSGARRRIGTRGQSLVEFALVLPILLLLLMVAIDFGRVYLGYINLQSMVRIGASYAAANPTGWSGGGNATIKATYQGQITNDARATNCVLPQVGGTPTAPDPAFAGTTLGSTVTVGLTCAFPIVTPVISSILGGSVSVSASAAFPVRSAQTATSGGGTLTAPTAIITATPTSGAPGTAVTFDGSLSQGSIQSWSWDFGNGQTSTSAVPAPVTYSSVGTYTSTLTVTNSAGSDSDSIVVVINNPVAVDFDADKMAGDAPLVVTFFDKTTGGPPTSWSWNFGDGGTSSAQNPTHVYAAPGSYDVTLTVDGAASATKQAFITVAEPLCPVPNFFNVSSSAAQGIWVGAGFTTQVKFRQGNLPWIIKSQSIVGNSKVVCSAVITVSKN